MSPGTTTLLVIGGLLLPAGTLVWMGVFWNPGGMSPCYPAADYDATLTREARTAAATIAALTRFHGEHAAFPADARALAAYMSATMEVDGWRYARSADGSSYSLSKKLGWDPCLVYEFDGTQARWFFSPGDGTADKVIRLAPGS